jgi:hypothetical protein
MDETTPLRDVHAPLKAPTNLLANAATAAQATVLCTFGVLCSVALFRYCGHSMSVTAYSEGPADLVWDNVAVSPGVAVVMARAVKERATSTHVEMCPHMVFSKCHGGTNPNIYGVCGDEAYQSESYDNMAKMVRHGAIAPWVGGLPAILQLASSQECSRVLGQLEATMPEYSSSFSRTVDDSYMVLKNRHVMFVGDSQSREPFLDLCHRYSVTEAQRPRVYGMYFGIPV